MANVRSSYRTVSRFHSIRSSRRSIILLVIFKYTYCKFFIILVIVYRMKPFRKMNCFDYRWLVMCVLFVACTVQSYVMTENQIQEDIKFLSQTSNGIKPSRLRALLLADLRRALPKVYTDFRHLNMIKYILPVDKSDE